MLLHACPLVPHLYLPLQAYYPRFEADVLINYLVELHFQGKHLEVERLLIVDNVLWEDFGVLQCGKLKGPFYSRERTEAFGLTDCLDKFLWSIDQQTLVSSL